ncbi:hypothetical protein BKA67DRAFT_580546 [Truncatella angustata]|uniref:Uncharacterized protein n=1 Tax=Truncatella angustata TaxID=152316 RepID=A0A9P8UCJ6_9PEZI|nr:uncharacterized protein BKA67DRAFT_580546 [Truncatella angustata]KAH6646776.1 hypothetical protein BKA67DRAFT_580546 [Truncatella angustata]
MASRRVIADSDDEDEGLSPIKAFAEFEAHDPRLDMEPLSPQHQPAGPILRQPSLLAVANAQNDTSGSTDPSFFANIFDEQQDKAMQQSHLIENIVRLSQKASAGSRDVSSPANGKAKSKGKKTPVNASSTATDITSPLVLKKPGPRKSQLVQMSDATEFTTPRKSAGKDQWDIPSSDDEHGKTAKKGVRESDSNADDSSKFYVAPSSLSASQRRQYRKVQISGSHSGHSTIPDSAALMQPHSNHKSSCATTVAVSTPSRYASSGPRPPWEIEQAADVRSEAAAINLTLSSPDAITAVGSNAQEDQSPVRRSSVKRKRSTARDDADELGEDGIFEDNISDLDPEFDPGDRQTSKKAKKAANSSSVPVVEPKKRGRKKKQPIVEKPSGEEQAEDTGASVTAMPEPAADVQTPEEKPKKKRGRPRKSDVAKPVEVSDEPMPAPERSAGKTTKSASAENGLVEDGSTTIEDSWKQPVVDASTDSKNAQPKPTTDKTVTRDVSPLKEADRNSLLASQSTISESNKSISKSMTPSQAGKAIYRVGLSKKSRIAPLLKIIRK